MDLADFRAEMSVNQLQGHILMGPEQSSHVKNYLNLQLHLCDEEHHLITISF